MVYQMDLRIPSRGWCVFTKENCSFCRKTKELIPEATFIASDEYLAKNRDLFLKTMDKLTSVQHRTFPMVFSDGTFVGGYTETKSYIDKLSAFDFDQDF